MLAIMHNAPAIASAYCIIAPSMSRGMGTAADRLRQARKASGYASAKSAAEAMGVPVATYIQHENGGRGIPAHRAQRYARFFRTQPEWILYGRESTNGHGRLTGKEVTIARLGPQIPIQGAVAAGVWRERMEFPEDEWETFTGRPDIDVPLKNRFGLICQGDSMDLVFPPGTILECVRYWGDEPITNGRRVIVCRTRIDGTVETTVKEYVEDADGVVWLVPRSSNPAHQAPFRCDQPEEGVTTVEVVALVVASTRYE